MTNFVKEVEKNMFELVGSNLKKTASSNKSNCCKCEKTCNTNCDCKLKEGCNADCNTCVDMKKKAWISLEQKATPNLSYIVTNLLALAAAQDEAGQVSESLETMKTAQKLVDMDKNEVSFLGQLIDDETLTPEDIEDYSENGEDDPRVQEFWMDFQQKYPDLAGELVNRTKSTPSENTYIDIANKIIKDEKISEVPASNDHEADLEQALELPVSGTQYIPEDPPPSSDSPTEPWIPAHPIPKQTEEEYAKEYLDKYKHLDEAWEARKDKREQQKATDEALAQLRAEERENLKNYYDEEKMTVNERPTVASVANKFLKKYANEFETLGLPSEEVEELDLDKDYSFNGDLTDAAKYLEEMAEDEEDQDLGEMLDEQEYESLFDSSDDEELDFEEEDFDPLFEDEV